MKKSILILVGICQCIMFACNDEYLDRVPMDKINDANFWKNTTDLETYCNQFYPGLYDADGGWRDDNSSDNMAPSNLSVFIWDLYVVPSSGGGWDKSDWANIRSCNYFLSKYSGVTGNASVIQKYVAEIRFFKAFYYFQKVKQFGDVPWLSSVLQVNSAELTAPRDSRIVVVDSIIKDLDFAVQYLPENSSTDRLTKYAALFLKSKVCLFEGTFRKYHNLGDYERILRESVNASELIMKSQKFSVYSTGNPESDYYDLFYLRSLRDNPENIFAQYFIEGVLMHNRDRIINEQGTGFTKDYAESYLCKDGKPISISSMYQGDALFVDEFVDRDPRMKQTIYTPDRPFIINNAGGITYMPVPEFNNARCNTGYRIIKCWSPKENDLEQNRSFVPVFVYRYSEILLNYPEAKAELGECTQQVLDETINLLRDRVGMPHMTTTIGFVDTNWPNWEVPVSPLINEIRRERRVELAIESVRFDDLRRWKAGKLLDNPKTYLGALDPSTGNYRVLYPGFTRTWNDKLYLYPLPIQDLTLNPKLTQNNGW